MASELDTSAQSSKKTSEQKFEQSSNQGSASYKYTARNPPSWTGITEFVIKSDADDEDASDSAAEDKSITEGQGPPAASKTDIVAHEAGHSDTTRQADVPPYLTAHRELLESSSDVFKARANFDFATSKLHTPIEVPKKQADALHSYLQWVYGIDGLTRTWDHYLECVIFADEYQAPGFMRFVLDAMLTKLKRKRWHPTLEQIDYIYENTYPTAGIRQLITVYAVKNRRDEMKEILKSAPSEFLSDFSLAAWDAAGKANSESTPEGQVEAQFNSLVDIPDVAMDNPSIQFHLFRFQATVSFYVQDTEFPAVAHLEAFCGDQFPDEVYEVHGLGMEIPHVGINSIQEFLSWVYYGEDIPTNQGKDAATWFQMYGAADSILKVPEMKNNTLAADDHKALLLKIHYQACRWKDAILDTIKSMYKYSGKLPTASEIQNVYATTTKREDPLRKLVASIVAWSSEPSALEMVELKEFQEDLNDAFILALKDKQGVLDRIHSLAKIRPPASKQSGAITWQPFIERAYGIEDQYQSFIFPNRAYERSFEEIRLEDYNQKRFSTESVVQAVASLLPVLPPYDRNPSPFHEAEKYNVSFAELSQTCSPPQPPDTSDSSDSSDGSDQE